MTYKTVVVCPLLPKDKEIPNQFSSVLHGQGAGFSFKYPSPHWRSKYPTLSPTHFKGHIKSVQVVQMVTAHRHSTCGVHTYNSSLSPFLCVPRPKMFPLALCTSPQTWTPSRSVLQLYLSLSEGQAYLLFGNKKSGRIHLYFSCLTLCLKSIGFLCLYFCSWARGR